MKRRDKDDLMIASLKRSIVTGGVFFLLYLNLPLTRPGPVPEITFKGISRLPPSVGAKANDGVCEVDRAQLVKLPIRRPTEPVLRLLCHRANHLKFLCGPPSGRLRGVLVATLGSTGCAPPTD